MKSRNLIVPTIYLLIVFCLTIIVYFTKEALQEKEIENINEEMTYVSNNILNKTIPVINIEETISAPYFDKNVKIARYFYNYTDELDMRKKSIVFYDDVYMPNTGIDYNNSEKFDVISIYSGTVIDVKDNDLMGKTVEIRHNNELISVYQGLDNIEVKKGDIIGFGMKIGTSGTSIINKDLGEHVHLEIYKNGEAIDPLKCMNKKIGDI